MESKPNIIENKTNGFSETDVYGCEDLHQLRRWLVAASKDRDILEGKIEREENKQDQNKPRITSLKSAHRLQSILADIIKNRIAELMDNNKEFYQLELNFFEQARKAVDNDEMSGELFETLIKRAQGYGKEI